MEVQMRGRWDDDLLLRKKGEAENEDEWDRGFGEGEERGEYFF